MKVTDPGYATTLTEAAIHACSLVMKRILTEVEDDPDVALETLRIGERLKKALRIDASAEDNLKGAVKQFRNNIFRRIQFYGEESLKETSLDLSKLTRTCALMDAVDGTDLVERGLGNWCSDVIFFLPSEQPGRRIIASVVALPNGNIYYANRDQDGAFVIRNGNRKKPLRLTAISKCRALKDASICFYGQKIKNLGVTLQTGLLKHFASLEERTGGKDVSARIYNLAGVPMMMRLIDPVSNAGRGIDAVFDAVGQQPHDVVPGAYIALKAGAVLKSLVDGPLELPELEAALMRPASQRLRYVLAGTEPLCDELIHAVGMRPRLAT